MHAAQHDGRGPGVDGVEDTGVPDVHGRALCGGGRRGPFDEPERCPGVFVLFQPGIDEAGKLLRRDHDVAGGVEVQIMGRNRHAVTHRGDQGDPFRGRMDEPGEGVAQIFRRLEEIFRGDARGGGLAFESRNPGRLGRLQQRRHVGAVEVVLAVGQREQVALAVEHHSFPRCASSAAFVCEVRVDCRELRPAAPVHCIEQRCGSVSGPDKSARSRSSCDTRLPGRAAGSHRCAGRTASRASGI